MVDLGLLRINDVPCHHYWPLAIGPLPLVPCHHYGDPALQDDQDQSGQGREDAGDGGPYVHRT
jgi:hypothetical protein